jgi:type VI secretion system protein ImpH
MATASRAEDLDLNLSEVEQDLQKEPWSFQFFQAVRLLQRARGHRRPVGEFAKPDEEAVRFNTDNALTFPPSEIHDIDWTNPGQPRLVVSFMGLTGLLGVLPYCYTELVIERIRAKDRTLQAFLDIFNHRIISFFYRAWEKYRFYIVCERGNPDQFARHLLDLLGLGTAGLQDRQAVLDSSLVHYSGLLSLQPRSATALRQILNDYFEVPVEIEQFAGSWYPLGVDAQCCLSDRNSVSQKLGEGAVVGDEIWNQQSRARIRLGPLSLERYLDFLPTGTAYEPLRALTRLFSNDLIDFEVQLILKRDEVPPCELGSEGDEAPQLGWVTWMKSAPLQRDPGETILRI